MPSWAETRERLLEEDESIVGFNIGSNSGDAAGQTIFHCHICTSSLGEQAIQTTPGEGFEVSYRQSKHIDVRKLSPEGFGLLTGKSSFIVTRD